jgi:hypothetical protein
MYLIRINYEINSEYVIICNSIQSHCPENKADFQKYRGGSPLEGKFTGDSRKLGIISSDYWEIFPPGDFLPNTLGNLLCFRDSAHMIKLIVLDQSEWPWSVKRAIIK